MARYTLNQYQEDAIRTLQTARGDRDTLVNMALGVAGEAGEFANQVKKCAFHGHEMDPTKALEELGDILWYVAAAAHSLGYQLELVADRNIGKLKRRYPEGFFEERSRNRDRHGSEDGEDKR